MGFVQVQKTKWWSATFGTVGKFAQLTADLIPGMIGKKVQAGAEEEYQHHGSIAEEVFGY